MSKVLEVIDLKKTYRSNFLIKSFPALTGISFSVEQGDIYGFLGPNGAGKTTTIKCITGLIKPNAGSIRINGESYDQVSSRRHFGYLPESPYFYDYLTASEFLFFNGRLLNMSMSQITERSRELLKLVGLAGKDSIPLRKFSKGMLQRVGLAQSMLQDPGILILDEPFSGLDPVGRKELRDIIFAEKERGKTIFFSSHILQDVEMIADEVAIIVKGSIARQGKLSELLSHTIENHEIVVTEISEKMLAEIHSGFIFKDGHYLLRLGLGENTNEIVESVIHNGGRIVSVTPIKKTLEDIFLQELGEEK